MNARSLVSRLSFPVLVLLLGVAGCISHEKLFDGPGDRAANAGAGGASGSVSGGGGYSFFDGDGDPGAAGSAGGTGEVADAGPLDPYVLPPSVVLGDAGVALCGSATCACNNGVDDDGDGKVDGFDEECTGAIDDDEATFSTGIAGDNSDPKWQDCFFDGNSGAGDDHCRYNTDCLTGEAAASDRACTVSAECHDFCQARTPNGCDCFGCCTVQLDDRSSVSVFIGSSCSLEDVGDADLCPRCTPSAACGNTCGECELCPGKTLEDLPASCSGGTDGPGGGGGDGSGGGGDGSQPPAYTCDGGGTVCGADGACPGGQYCSLGCCLDFVIR